MQFIHIGRNFDRDLRARLELGVERVAKLVKEQEQSQPQDSDYTSDSEDVSMNKHRYTTYHRLKRKNIRMCTLREYFIY